ncbi:exported protein of unknown function [Nitrospira japonica]|uniref:IPT/TIG domain-containing protein n=1 Tax=Nitrospira japonica TaxID=1325564 RepID=A0A1W1I0L7_9BACT|nr:hypothetical protein [Nitrospira japonica]SLM46531.1 exported protein of unknown function [Nitrospira japonica]
MNHQGVWGRVSYGGALLACLVTGLAGPACVFADEEKPDEVESRGMPRIERPVQPGMSISPGSAAQQPFQFPTWPQQFDIENRQLASFGFAVTQPGPVVVNVQFQGPPLDITLRGSNTQPIVQRGQGNIRLSYQVTPQDVQRGILWVVRISLAPNTQGKATGQVMIQYPAVHEAQAESAVRTRVEEAKQRTQLNDAQVQARRQALFAARQSELDRQYQDVIRVTGVQLDAFLKQAQSGGKIQSRGFGQPGVLYEGKKTPQMSAIPSGPHIDKLSVTQGPPGSTVIIEGSGFGNVPRFVHMTAPTRELFAKVVGAPAQPIWSDGFIAVTVPEIAGVLPFMANFFVSIGVDPSSPGPEYRSNSVPFQYIPRQEARVITLVTGDHRIDDVGGSAISFVKDNIVHHTKLGTLIPVWGMFLPFVGKKGNDWFFENTTLKNGWKFDCVEVLPYDPRTCGPTSGPTTTVAYGVPPGSGAYVVAGLGTSSPQFAVHWWLEPFIPEMTYTYAVTISGPAGTPDGILVP